MHTLAALVSAFVLPGFTHSPVEPGGGQLLNGRFPGAPRAGFVYLPPGFDSRERYPVVYLLHGLPGSPSEYVDGAQLAQFADAAITAGALRPFIAIIPAAGTSPGYDGEWAGRWENEIVETIVPWVDANLPTIASPTGRIIAGLSAGGYGAIDIALRHPGVFATAESWSGYFDPLLDGPFKHAGRLTLEAHDPVRIVRAEAPRLRAAGTRFFISTGPRHSRRITPQISVAFARELRQLRLPVTYRSYPHTEREWRDQLDAGLTWALARSSRAAQTGSP